MNEKHLEWVLRLGIFGTFLGHGIFALSIKADWFKYFTKLGIAEPSVPTLLLLIGIMDVLVACIVLWKPYKFVLGWAVLWGFATALIRPVTAGDTLFSGIFSLAFMDFVERAANFMMPLALLVYHGWPQTWKEWFTA